MNDFPLSKFIALVQFDQNLGGIERSIEQERAIITQQEAELGRLNQRAELIRKQRIEAKKRLDAQELDMQTLDQAIQEKRPKLDTLKNHREVQALYQEIEQLKKEQHLVEERLLAAWQESESIQRTSEQEMVVINQAVEQAQSLIQKHNEQIDQLQKQLQEKQQQRSAQEEGVPAAWLEKYAMMRSRVPNPVVPVIQGCCSACFYRIPQQDLLNLRRRVMLQCKDCYRFLYDETADLSS